MTYRPGPEYPYSWNRLRYALFKKHGYICQRCGRYAKGDLHLHHKIPVKMGGSHSESNLEVLCSDCHLQEHLRRRYK